MKEGFSSKATLKDREQLGSLASSPDRSIKRKDMEKLRNYRMKYDNDDIRSIKMFISGIELPFYNN